MKTDFPIHIAPSSSSSVSIASVWSLSFDDLFCRTVEGIPLNTPQFSNAARHSSRISRQTEGVAYSEVLPTPVAKPTLLCWSADLAKTLGFADDVHTQYPRYSQELADVLGGNVVVTGMRPYAACYGGHQFGTWAGQLGDGRAMTLCEVVPKTTDSAKPERYEIQLKGAGPTPYSRRSDGRAVLRSSIREYLCSEAMYALGVPTTRALALVSTGDLVVRDMFYDGNPEEEQGAIVTRVAPSFIRFGSFEIFASRGEDENLQKLADFVIQEHFIDIARKHAETNEQVNSYIYGDFYHEVCRRTATLIADWMRFGFVHGVMNTDNMSILGLTLDYGPYGWLDGYDADFTPNTSDRNHRYAYGMQPRIALWNLQKLGFALVSLFEKELRARFSEQTVINQKLQEILDEGVQIYRSVFNKTYVTSMLAKFGLVLVNPQDIEGQNDARQEKLQENLKKLMEVFDIPEPISSQNAQSAQNSAQSSGEIDMTLFFRTLADLWAREQEPAQEQARAQEQVQKWAEALLVACYDVTPENRALYKQHLQQWTTVYFSIIQENLFVQYSEQKSSEHKNSEHKKTQQTTRAEQMKRVNPSFIVRNYAVHEAIQAAEQGDLSLVHALYAAARTPYADVHELPEMARKYVEKRPIWARTQAGCSRLSCSS